MKDDRTLVNTFRTVFNVYFGSNYDILEDKMYWQTNQKPYSFDEVGIICAFKPMIDPNSETYCIAENGGKSIFVDIEKQIQKGKMRDPQWDKFKISDHTQFSGDEEKISSYRQEMKRKLAVTETDP